MRLATAGGRRCAAKSAIGSQKELARRCLDLKDQFRPGLKASSATNTLSNHGWKQHTLPCLDNPIITISVITILGNADTRTPYTKIWLLHLNFWPPSTLRVLSHEWQKTSRHGRIASAPRTCLRPH